MHLGPFFQICGHWLADALLAHDVFDEICLGNDVYFVWTNPNNHPLRLHNISTNSNSW